jgi:hypothetical protein
LIGKAVDVCLSVVPTHPEALTLPTFGTPSVETVVNQLGFHWMLRWDDHPKGVVRRASQDAWSSVRKGMFLIRVVVWETMRM